MDGWYDRYYQVKDMHDLAINFWIQDRSVILNDLKLRLERETLSDLPRNQLR